MSLETQLESNLQAGQSYSAQIGEAMEQYKTNSNWWVVYASFDLPDFTASPLWIAQRTGLEITEVVEALDGLATLGFLNKAESAFYPTDRPGNCVPIPKFIIS